MRYLRILPFSVLLFALASPAFAGDVDDLKAAFAKVTSALENKDLDQLVGAMHPEAVIYGPGHLFPIDRSEIESHRWRQMFDDMFATIISAGYTKKNVKYRVIGTTGFVWGDTRMAVDTRTGENSTDKDSRLTVVFVRQEGRWLIAQWHESDMPVGARSLLKN